MIKFDISPYIGQTAESAILHLTRFYSCPSGGTTASTFYAISEEWTEETWDHIQHIQYDPSINMPYVFSGNGGNTIVQFEVDITDFINTFLEGSFENNGFVIKANSNQKFSKFYSKEYSNTDYRPSLVITFPDIDVDEQVVAGNIEFLRNYPNPFKPSGAGHSPVTTISFNISRKDAENAVEFLRNYPNPFKPSGAGHSPVTTISFNISRKDAENAELIIYNIKGQKIRRFSIFNNQSSITWNGRDESNNTVASGIYFYQIKSANSVKMNKMILMK
jgi:hypothetical protein